MTDINFNFNSFIIVIYAHYMVVIVLCFEQGHSIGLPDRVFSFNNVQIFADGKMSSDFEDEFNPSLSLNLSDALILKAGSTITV